MALERNNKGEIPHDAVILKEYEAIAYETKILNNWPDKADIYGYKYGRGVLAVSTLFSGIYANNFFRSKFKLFNYGRLSSYLPICVVPAAMSALVHHNLILPKLMLRKDECPVCLQTRAAAFQTMLGCVLPFVVAPIMSLSLVHRFHTYNLPYISKEPMKVFKIIGKQFIKMKNVGFGIFLGQALIASVVTYLESESVYKVNMKLIQLEKTLELDRQNTFV